MKQYFIKKLAILLVIALVVPVLGLAEGIQVNEVMNEPGIEDAINAVALEILEPEDGMSDISVPLDGLAADGVLDESLSLDELEEDLSNDNDSPLELGEDMEAVDVSNAVKKKYGVPAQLTLGVKEAFALKCTKKKLTFESSSPKVAKVSAKGVVTALKKGKATITVYSNKKKLTTCAVTVVAAPKKVTLSAKKATLGVKEKLTLVPQITKNSHTSFTWTVKNKKIATVSKAGVVTGVKAGKTTVTVKTHNGKKATLNVTVVKAPKKVSFRFDDVTLGVKEQLAATPILTSGSHAGLTWSVKDKKIATVTGEGVIKGVKAGKTTVTVKTHNGKKATLNVTVVKAPKKVSFKPKAVSIGVKEQLAVEPVLTAGSHASLTWSVKNKKIATVSQSGVITGKKAGKTAVTVKTHNGKKATLTVTVVKAPTKVKLNKKKATLQIGDNLQLKASFPKGQASKLTWTSSALTVAYVDENGLVTALSEGSATVTATAFNGKKAVCAITVKAQKQAKSTQDSLSRDLEMLEQLDENPASIGIEEMTFEKLSTEGIEDKTLLKEVKAFNSAQSTLEKEINSFNKDMDKLSKQLASLDSTASDAGLQLKGNKLSVSGIGFSVDLTNMEKIGNDAEILSVKASSNENSIAIEVKSGGKKYTIVSDRNGVRVLTGSAANAALAAHKNAVTSNAIAVQNGFWSSFGDAVMKGVKSIETGLGYIGNIVDECVKHAEEAFEAADESFKSAERMWKVRLANPNEPAVHMIDEKQYLKAKSNMNAAKGVLESARNFKKMMGAVSLPFTIKAIYEVNKNIIELGKVWNHNHPTASEKQNARQLELADKLNKNLATAEIALGISGSLAFLDLVTQLNDFFTFAKALLGPAGLVVNLASVMALKVTKKLILDTAKKMGVQLAIDAAGNGAYKEVMDLDEKLHNIANIRGKVIDKDTKKPLSGVEVSCPDYGSKTTDSNGKFEFKDVFGGEYEISFDKKGYEHTSENVTLEGIDAVLDVVMEKSVGTVKGTVYDKDTGKALSGVSVSCEGCDTVTTDANGKYNLEKVPVGEQEISFVKKAYKTVSKTATVNEGKETSLDAQMEKKSGTVKGKVYDKNTYTEIEGVSVSCDGCDTVTTNAKGEYTLEKVPVGEQKIRFVKKGYATVNKTATVNEGEETSLDAEMEKKVGTVKGKVYDKNTNEPLSYVIISCEGCRSVITGVDGTYTLDKVPAGKNEICFTLSNYLDAKIEVNVTANEVTPLDVAMEADGFLIDKEHFPDDAFRAYVTEMFDFDNNRILTQNEITWAYSLTIDSDEIASLEGVKYFTKLNSLKYSGNNLKALDVSGLKELFSLNIGDNENRNSSITSINVNGCTSLDRLYLWTDNLTKLDVGGCSSLQSLTYVGNELKTLDVSELKLLKDLKIGEYREPNKSLKSFNASGCISLEGRIDFDHHELTYLNMNGCSSLSELSCEFNHLTSLDVRGCTSLTTLRCGANQLTNLDCTGCTSLTKLYCWDNHLTSLNVSGCRSMTDLSCDTNELTSLNVSGCNELTNLSCSGNKLSDLDVSGCKKLTYLDCQSNKLTNLNTKGLTKLEKIYYADNMLTGNLDLSCYPNLQYIDFRFNYFSSVNATGCSSLYSFEFGSNPLISMDLSGCTSLEKICCNRTGDANDLESLESLNVSGCTSLKILACPYMQIKTVNVSGCTSLEDLELYYNQLSDIDVSGFKSLKKLGIDNNRLTSLDVSGCTSLTGLFCFKNQLTNLNVRGCTSLTRLSCYENQLTNLNVRGLTSLKELKCYKNKLTKLVLTNEPFSVHVEADENVEVEWDYEW